MNHSLSISTNRHETIEEPIYVNVHEVSTFAEQAARAFLMTLREALHDVSQRQIIVGLSGGTTPESTYRLASDMATKDPNTQWNRIVFFLTDERYCPVTNEHSNQRRVKENLLRGAFGECKLYHPDVDLELDECIHDYSKQLNELFHYARPSVITFGFGTDGHVAAWFPPMSLNDISAAYNTDKLVHHTMTEKFPVKHRLSVSMHLLLSARSKLLFLNGEEKVKLFKSIISHTATDDTLGGAMSPTSNSPTSVSPASNAHFNIVGAGMGLSSFRPMDDQEEVTSKRPTVTINGSDPASVQTIAEALGKNGRTIHHIDSSDRFNSSTFKDQIRSLNDDLKRKVGSLDDVREGTSQNEFSADDDEYSFDPSIGSSTSNPVHRKKPRSKRMIQCTDGPDGPVCFLNPVATQHPISSADYVAEQPLLQIIHSGSLMVVAYPPINIDEIHALRQEALKCRAITNIVVLGASGDLAMKKTFPALYSLYLYGHLPPNTFIHAYMRRHLSIEELYAKWEKNLLKLSGEIIGVQVRDSHIDKFLSMISIHTCTTYGDIESAGRLHRYLCQLEDGGLPEGFQPIDYVPPGTPYQNKRLLLYLALPPDQFVDAVKAFKHACWRGGRLNRNPSRELLSILLATSDSECDQNERPELVEDIQNVSWTRCVVEKPFGRDLESAKKMTIALKRYAKEEELYRIDHYLGKEMVQNLFVLRFANTFITPLWNRMYVRAVRITFKEELGTDGRGGYFDHYGIIRDVIQNHLIQILSLIAMEAPVSLADEHVRDEKVRLLKCIRDPPRLADTVVGQYVGNGDLPGYLDDPTVPTNSITPTFVTTVLYVNNERWNGVPFILKAGKALESAGTEVRVLLHEPSHNLFRPDPASSSSTTNPSRHLPKNQIVFRIQPDDAVYLKCVSRQPGILTAINDFVETELDLSILDRLGVTRVHDAYERLLLDVIRGDKKNFVRDDELIEAWRIFTPLLSELEQRRVTPIPYVRGSRGPIEAYQLMERMGYDVKKRSE